MRDYRLLVTVIFIVVFILVFKLKINQILKPTNIMHLHYNILEISSNKNCRIGIIGRNCTHTYIKTKTYSKLNVKCL